MSLCAPLLPFVLCYRYAFSLLSSVVILLHAILKGVTKESRQYYDESMILLTVDGDTEDEYDRYLNGVGMLHLKRQ